MINKNEFLTTSKYGCQYQNNEKNIDEPEIATRHDQTIHCPEMSCLPFDREFISLSDDVG